MLLNHVTEGGKRVLIVGQVSSKEEANEITFIARCFLVGVRARFLGRQSRKLSRKSRKIKK